MESFDILVIILSIFLAAFLIAGIVLLIVSIKLVKQIKHISSKAEDIMDNVESVSGFFKKSAGPVALTSVISNIISKVTEHTKSSKKGK